MTSEAEREFLMRNVLAAAACTAALLVANASPAVAITWGQPDGNDHPHVVTLLFQQGDGFYSCSGTLLSPTLVLTAGHCTESGGAVNTATWVSNDPDPLADYDGTGIVDYLQNDDDWVTGAAVPHPEYDDFARFPQTYDIGAVVLDAPIDTGGVYGTLPEEDFLEQFMTRKMAASSRSVVVVGYGLQGTIPAFEQADYVRYQGRSTILGLGRSGIEGTHSVRLSNNPSVGTGSGGTCFGDSGGPAFLVDPVTGLETTTVVAVTSFGITGQCAGIDFSFRTDIAAAQDFLAPLLP